MSEGLNGDESVRIYTRTYVRTRRESRWGGVVGGTRWRRDVPPGIYVKPPLEYATINLRRPDKNVARGTSAERPDGRTDSGRTGGRAGSKWRPRSMTESRARAARQLVHRRSTPSTRPPPHRALRARSPSRAAAAAAAYRHTYARGRARDAAHKITRARIGFRDRSAQTVAF